MAKKVSSVCVCAGLITSGWVISVTSLEGKTLLYLKTICQASDLRVAFSCKYPPSICTNIVQYLLNLSRKVSEQGYRVGVMQPRDTFKIHLGRESRAQIK